MFLKKIEENYFFNHKISDFDQFFLAFSKFSKIWNVKKIEIVILNIYMLWGKKYEVLPGLEPGSKDSESLVITNYTTRPQATSTGFEPMRAEPSRFRVYRLNHSAKMPMAVAAGPRYAQLTD